MTRLRRAWNDLLGRKNSRQGTVTVAAIITRTTGEVEEVELGSAVIEMSPALLGALDDEARRD